MDLVIAIVAAGVAFGLLGYAVGRSGGRGESAGRAQDLATRLGPLLEALERGRTAAGLAPGSPEAEIQAALEKGWAPRESEREAALREAVGRVSAFLAKNVREPLSGAGDRASYGELRERIGKALGALEDLDFFVREASEAREGTDLGALAQQVSREFVGDQGVGVRLALSESAAHASVNASALMDALYLVLHNAGRFGGGQTIDLSMAVEGSNVTIKVRDRGPGFSEEAFRRAFDPFYSTSDEGLGLGLPHVRKIVESMGGRVGLRNVPDGGAEVELSFPAARG